MSDQDEALKADVEENNNTESPAEEANLSEVSETTTEETTVETEETPETEDKRSANTRIRELVAEKKAEEAARLKAEDEARSLKDVVAELKGVTPENQNNIPQFTFPEPTQPEPLVKPGEEYIDPVELERRIQEREKIRDQRLIQTFQLNNVVEKNTNRIVDELNDAQSKYPQLVKGSDQFDPDISEAVHDSAETFIKANPMGSVKKHIDGIMKPYLKAIEKRVGEEKETITKQVSETALRPTHIAPGEKSFGDMSYEEMEKALGGVHR